MKSDLILLINEDNSLSVTRTFNRIKHDLSECKTSKKFNDLLLESGTKFLRGLYDPSEVLPGKVYYDLMNIGSEVTYERNIHIINLSNASCIIRFAEKFIKMHMIGLYIAMEGQENVRNLKLRCNAGEYRHYSLQSHCNPDKGLEYSLINSI